MHRVGIVDLGSNTARLAVYGYEPGRWLRLLDGIRETVRLGEGMGKEDPGGGGRLSEAAAARALAALKLFSDYAATIGLTEVEVVGTSALRDAADPQGFVAAAAELGFTVRILSGEEEAEIGALAVANGFDFADSWAIDLGGGSAQLSRLAERRYVPGSGQAYPLGSVRLTEAHLTSDPPRAKEVRKLEKTVARHLGPAAAELAASDLPLVAMGGTIRNLARAAQKRWRYPLSQLHGYFLAREQLEAITETLLTSDTAARARVPGILPDRADIIVAGALVYRWLLAKSGRPGVLISGSGIREGLFYRHFLPPPHLLADVREFSVTNLLAKYPQPPAHSEHVRRLAGRLFAALAKLHRLGEEEERLLDVAARLHDVGNAVAYYRHHKHGAYLVGSVPMAGFSHRQQALLMLLVRYHHKGNPTLGELRSLTRPGDKRLLLQLVTCLRLAEYVERSQAQRVRDVEVEVERKQVRLRLLATDEPVIELWEVGRQEELFRRAFGRKLVVEAVVMPAAG